MTSIDIHPSAPKGCGLQNSNNNNNHNNSSGGNGDENESNALLGHNHISGKKPDWVDAGKAAVHCIECLGCFACMLWVACFILMSLLLHRANTMEVRVACAGFWDFMLISLLSPVLIPSIYCIFSFVMWWNWYAFSGSCMLILAVASLHMTLNASENSACVEAIRLTTKPIPWLLYAGWIKSVVYCAGAVSSLCGHVANNNSHNK
jgi:hypothetical protein